MEKEQKQSDFAVNAHKVLNNAGFYSSQHVKTILALEELAQKANEGPHGMSTLSQLKKTIKDYFQAALEIQTDFTKSIHQIIDQAEQDSSTDNIQRPGLNQPPHQAQSEESLAKDYETLIANIYSGRMENGNPQGQFKDLLKKLALNFGLPRQSRGEKGEKKYGIGITVNMKIRKIKNIKHKTSSIFGIVPYIKIRVCDQSATSKTALKGYKEPIFNEDFTFFIKNYYNKDDRRLELELWDSNRTSNKTSDSLIGFGIMDLDSILQFSNEKTPKLMRILLHYNNEPAADVEAEINFIEHPIKLLNIRFEQFLSRRKFNDGANCYVQVTIGDEKLITQKKSDTFEKPPAWTDQILTINIQQLSENCLIKVFDDDGLVGNCALKLQPLLKYRIEKKFTQEILFNKSISGTLKFQTKMTKIGENVEFSQQKKN